MIRERLRIFGLLLYKNLMVRKRRWKMGLLVEIMIPLFLFISLWVFKNLQSDENPPVAFTRNVSYPIEIKDKYLIQSKKHLYIVPDHPFIKTLIDEVYKCLQMNHEDSIKWFQTEEDMLKELKTSETPIFDEHRMAVVFENTSSDLSLTHLKYKIRIPKELPKRLLYRKSTNLNDVDIFIQATIGLQLCLDESFIKIKGKDSQIEIYMQRMPVPAQLLPETSDRNFGKTLRIIAVLAFLVPLCIETSYASDEKFLGTNVLMAMNGVPNYLNLLSWLLSGLIFSLFYTIPIVVLMNSSHNENVFPFLKYGNPFLFWLTLTLHVAHLITFGMHVSAYFTKPSLLVTAISVLYAFATVIQKYGIKKDAYGIIPYLGIFFPNILLYRAVEEVNYYESIMTGIQWNNLFRIWDLNYGRKGSIGMILVFSLLGTIIHFIMANYVCAINPGKYGIKKHLFYFLDIFKRSKRSGDYDKVETFEFNDSGGKPFESVAEGAYVPGIQIRNLRKTFSASLFNKMEVHALRGISVDFFQGQITVLLGHNGAGKTTMMSILTGMTSPSEGLVFINGNNVKNNTDEMSHDIGLCPQENILFPKLSVCEQLTFFAMLKNKNKPKSYVDSTVKSLLEKLKLYEQRNIIPRELSEGQKRKLSLGMALIGDSSTFILDEPTSGLDPESRRDIWDILMKMREKKTILISTQDMEEADILADRIAVVHHGNLRCYGTSMFLKKLFGHGNIEISLTTEPWCDLEEIRNFLVSESQIFKQEGGKVQISIPPSPELPDALDEIERRKKGLGIITMNVSLITLEQIFLQVTQDDNDVTDSSETLIITDEKLTGLELYLNSAMALLRKKMTYTQKNISTIFTMIFLLVLAFICVSIVLSGHTAFDQVAEPVAIRPDLYRYAKTCYKTNNNTKTYGDSYKSVSEEFNSKVIGDFENNNFTQALIQLGLQDIIRYDYHVISGAEFKGNSSNIQATALYNPLKATFALPISINLLTNSLIKQIHGANHGVSMQVQELPRFNDYMELYRFGDEDIMWIESHVVPILLTMFLYTVLALFVIHPIRETDTKIKHLQRMSGVSGTSYWGTMFVFDFVVFLAMTMFIVVGLLIMDAAIGLKMFRGTEVLLMILLYVLLALNVLPLIYTFSFWKKSTRAAVILLTIIPLGLVAVEYLMYYSVQALNIKTLNVKVRPVQKGIFLLTPYVSFFHGQLSLFSIIHKKAECRRGAAIYDQKNLCTYTNCCPEPDDNENSEETFKYFNNFKGDVTLELSMLSLCLTSLLYIGILCILEHKLIPLLLARIQSVKNDDLDHNLDEEVKKVKYSVASDISKIKCKRMALKKTTDETLENIENGTNDILPNADESNNYAILVYELNKLYKKSAVVTDLNFGINQSECFGLLGVNGAGKTTTFKIITGEIIPNNGKMYLDSKNIRKHRNYCLSQIGYCPQNDALLKSLNAYDHLRLFAHLRGIPKVQIDKEVKKWIDKVDLKACASLPAGVYSGGNKRRLNIAIALIGDPKVVLLDEPTTGVDPAGKRALWDIIKACQATGQTIMLTSHSMEECEALCNRLAILMGGKLKCIGPSHELKQRFGTGYTIQLKLNPEKSKNEIYSIKEDITKALDCEIINETSGYLMYHLTTAEITWRRIYDVVGELKNKYTSIEDFSVLSSTLEQLFLMFARAADPSRNTKTK